jgi:hypothetical protein
VAGRGPAGIVRAVLVEPCGEKNQVAASGGRGGGALDGEVGQATRKGREAQHGPLGHDGGKCARVRTHGCRWVKFFYGLH